MALSAVAPIVPVARVRYWGLDRPMVQRFPLPVPAGEQASFERVLGASSSLATSDVFDVGPAPHGLRPGATASLGDRILCSLDGGRALAGAGLVRGGCGGGDLASARAQARVARAQARLEGARARIEEDQAHLERAEVERAAQIQVRLEEVLALFEEFQSAADGPLPVEGLELARQRLEEIRAHLDQVRGNVEQARRELLTEAQTRVEEALEHLWEAQAGLDEAGFGRDAPGCGTGAGDSARGPQAVRIAG